MNTFELLGQGLLTAMQWSNLLYALIGVTLGTAVGANAGAAAQPVIASAARIVKEEKNSDRADFGD